jgi:hypothetical protein
VSGETHKHRAGRGIQEAALALIVCMLFPSAATSNDLTKDEYRLKANFLATSPSFVDWPQDAKASSRKTFSLCVYGAFDFGTTLAEMTRANTVHGLRVDVKWIRKETQLPGCNLAFISGSEQRRYAQLLQGLQGMPVLTVGETPGFLEAGGMLNLEIKGSTLQFDVNLAATERAHLKISSRLLVIARRVIGASYAARG